MAITTSLRRIPKNMSTNRKKIVEAVYDFFGQMTSEEKKIAKRITLFMLGRKRGIDLAEEEKDVMWYVRQNLASEYRTRRNIQSHS